MLLEGNMTGIQHIGIPVKDINSSKNFYGQLGFKEVFNKDFTHDNAPAKVSFMQHNGILIELYQLANQNQSQIVGPIDHISFSVKDLEKAYLEIKAAGMTIIQEPTSLDFWEKGCKFFIISGPNKERLEFNQIY